MPQLQAETLYKARIVHHRLHLWLDRAEAD